MSHCTIQYQRHSVRQQLLHLGHRLAAHRIVGGRLGARGVHRLIESDADAVAQRLRTLNFRSGDVRYHAQLSTGRPGRCYTISGIAYFQGIGTTVGELSHFNFVAERVAKELSSLCNDLTILLPDIFKRIIARELRLELITGSCTNLSTLNSVHQLHRCLREALEILRLQCGVVAIGIVGGYENTHSQRIARNRTHRHSAPARIVAIH